MVRSFNDDFAVTWDDPAEAEHVWGIDRNHFAHPLPPLGQELLKVLVERTWEKRCAFVNGYLYMRDLGPAPVPPEVFERGALAIWREDYLPKVRAVCEQLRVLPNETTPAALADCIPVAFDEAAEAFRLTTVVALTIMASGLELVVFCHEKLGEDGAILAASLLQGFANESAKAGAELSMLASLAAGNPEVAAAVRAGSMEAFEQERAAAPFLARFRAFLDAYGWRAEDWSLPHVPVWAEEPGQALKLIARYLDNPANSPEAAMGRASEQREAAAAAIRRRLDPADQARFEELLAAASAHVEISEERAMWQLNVVGSARVPVLALGRKLAATAVIDLPNDVFFLSLDEGRKAVEKPERRQILVAERKAELARWQRLQPLLSVGAPIVFASRPLASQIAHRFFFGTMAGASSETTLRGNPASQGVVLGRARVIQGLADADRLEAGEILVCRATSPPWTPLFAVAGGVVTETGGLLSHSAICAREYAIPCVVGVAAATTKIADGALVTVDGAQGTVTIEQG